ncbi:hydroxyacylglutathione hydrolase, mitochondrial-like [Diorhabda sublineata]|uniref:hydroxyacylglutathione hydrolase, mitochondrial-like n=1 Tax=Diorhabda sublineata TaxID=1163346 RepID=UPI0024E18843|nr:hydroxyacylglutathione hydrolase, mitochondrial-like [Diorhabda sublineata]
MSKRVKVCCVPGCMNKQAKRHSIPTNEDVSRIWLQRINNPKLMLADTVLSSHRICGIYFEPICRNLNGRLPLHLPGDTLFVAGCGRFFEGTAEQMYSALIEKLGNLPDNTRVFCGHEYTIQNLKFARFIDKQNPEILKKMSWADEQRKKGLPTVRETYFELLFN